MKLSQKNCSINNAVNINRIIHGVIVNLYKTEKDTARNISGH